MSVPPQARLAAVAVAVLLVLGGALYVLFLRGGDDEPTARPARASATRAGAPAGRRSTPSEIGAASPRTGSDPAPPSEDEIDALPRRRRRRPVPHRLPRHAARHAVSQAAGRDPVRRPPADREQLRAAPAALRADLQAPGGRARGQPPGAARRRAAGGRRLQRVRQPRAARRRSTSARAAARRSPAAPRRTAEQLKALGVGVNLAPNADIAVAGGPGQGRAFSDSPAKVATAVKATVARVQRARRGARPSARSRATARHRRTRTPARRRSGSRSRSCARPTSSRSRPWPAAATRAGDADVQRDLRRATTA